MHPEASKIDILFFSPESSDVNISWDLGQTIAITSATGKDVINTISEHLAITNSDWVLLWDSEFGQPDIELINELSAKPVDTWHAGLRMGLAEKPNALNYVMPTWMYNKDASPEVEHTSFRMSIGAALIRTDVLRQVCPVAGYSSLAMAGLALGYKILRSGGIIRYHPQLLKQNHATAHIAVKDEWIFLKEFFPLKWQLWTIINKPGVFKNFISWLSVRNTQQQRLKPSIHSSKKVPATVSYSTVSVLAPTLNRYTYLVSELEQLALQTALPLEVLVTDQTDEKDRIELDFSKYPNLNIRYFQQNEKGQCIAWNKLLEEAKGEYVLFLGDDADDIKPDFIEQLLLTQKRFECDMVASNVIEAGITYGPLNEHYYLSDTFPITLIKKALLQKTGFLDMFFNKNIRADHELAMRCHLQGAMMIFNPSATIFHHRAPVGGLRTHNARAITSNMVKKSVTKFLNPTTSEIYLVKKYYNSLQVRNYVKIKYLNQLFIKGNVLKKILRLIVFTANLPSFRNKYKLNEEIAVNELDKRS